MATTGTSSRHSQITAVLDTGTAKVVCLIAARLRDRPSDAQSDTDEPGLRVLGVGHQQSRGVKGGVIIDLNEAEACIRAAIAQAERMAGVTLDQVLLTVSCGRLKSQDFTASADIAGTHVSVRDLARLMGGARAFVERDGRRLVHLNRKAMHLDGFVSDGDNIGMAAREITAYIHAVSADEAPIRNLLTVLERCHIQPAGVIVAPFASALAVTTAEERHLGVNVIDIGSGTTKLAAFSGGHLVHVRSVPFGSSVITTDIARALHTPLIEAERIKALYGNLLSARSDEHEGFSYPRAGVDEGLRHHMTRAELASIIRPRAAELLRAALLLLDGSGLKASSNEPLVLTGGGSQLTGLVDYASGVLQRPVRLGQAAVVSGLPPIARTPAFATALGAMIAAGRGDATSSAENGEGLGQGYFQRVGAWLKNGF